MKKKNIILIAVIALAVLLVVAGILYFKNWAGQTPPGTAAVNPVFMTDAEVTGLGYPSGTKIQSLKPGVYKIIRSDKDIVDPAKVSPISPHATTPQK